MNPVIQPRSPGHQMTTPEITRNSTSTPVEPRMNSLTSSSSSVNGIGVVSHSW